MEEETHEWRVRVEAEYSEIKERCNKLSIFLDESISISSLSEKEYLLLVEQEKVLVSYKRILERRLALFGSH